MGLEMTGHLSGALVPLEEVPCFPVLVGDSPDFCPMEARQELARAFVQALRRGRLGAGFPAALARLEKLARRAS